MSTTSAFAGVKVQARVNVRSQRAQTVIMASGAGPKKVSTPTSSRCAIFRDPTRAGRGATRAIRAITRCRGATTDRVHRKSFGLTRP
jgi:hypothetical protein